MKSNKKKSKKHKKEHGKSQKKKPKKRKQESSSSSSSSSSSESSDSDWDTFMAQGSGNPLIILYSIKTVVCRHCGNMAPNLVRHKCHLQEQRFTKAPSLQELTPRWKWKMFWRGRARPRNLFRYIISFSFQTHCHFTFGICCVQTNLWWRMVHWLSSSWKNAVVVGFHTLSFESCPFLHFYCRVLPNWIMWEQISLYCLNF